jgi:hypothetical protein
MSSGVYEGRTLHAGVPLFWPLTRWELVAPFRPFPAPSFDRSLHPLVALIVSPDYWKRVVLVELAYCAFFLILWSAIWGSLRLVYTRLRKKSLPSITTTETSSPFQRS